MSQQVAIITGGSSGIGFNATKKLVEKGIHCTIASRNIAKVNNAVEKIKTETGRDNLEGMALSLCDFESVRRFVEDFKAMNLPLHLLINNAGIVTRTREITACGLESTFVANHLGHFLLTNLLLDKLKASAPSRIIVVASTMHDPTKGQGSRAALTLDTFNFDDEATFDSTAAYRFSKLANIWFTYHLNRMLEGSGVTVNCLCPGFIPETSLSREYPAVLQWILRNVMSRFLNTRTPDYGGDFIVDLAVNPLITTGGHFYYDREKARSSERSNDEEEQRKMWEYSAKIVGL